MKIKCPFCQTEYDVESKYIGQKIECSSCNNEFIIENPNLIHCKDCFAMISKHALVCPHCGVSISNNIIQNEKETTSIPNIINEKEILTCNPLSKNYCWLIIFGIITIPLFFFGLFILLYVWIQTNFTSYKITNLRIIIQHNFIIKRQDEVWIKDIRGITCIQGIWQRTINTGNVSLDTAATVTNFIGSPKTVIYMSGIYNPQQIVNTINSLRK